MRAHLINDDASAFAALVDADLGLANIQFQGYPRIALRFSAPLNVFQVSKAVTAVEFACHRMYGLFAKGTTNRSHLTKDERKKIRPDVDQGADRKSLTFDLTNVANAALAAVRLNMAMSENPQQLTFASMWQGLLAKLPKVPKKDAGRVVAKGLIALVVAAASVTCLSVSLHYALESQKEENRFIAELFSRDDVSISRNESGEVTFDRQAQRRAENSIAQVSAHQEKVLRDIVPDAPLVHFVMHEAEKLRPALLEIASEFAHSNINGIEFSGDQAKRAAKAIRKNVKKGLGPWSTTVIMS